MVGGSRGARRIHTLNSAPPMSPFGNDSNSLVHVEATHRVAPLRWLAARALTRAIVVSEGPSAPRSRMIREKALPRATGPRGAGREFTVDAIGSIH